MKTSAKKPESVSEYISNFPKSTQQILRKVRALIKKAAPEAKEKISYGIPTFTLSGNLVHFAGYEHHIGFYPGSLAIKMFAEDLEAYETSKGTIRFPIEKPIPLRLITRIVKFRVKMNTTKKTKKKTTSARKRSSK